MKDTFDVCFNINGLNGLNSLYRLIPGMEDAMKAEFVRVYNLYAHKCNDGVTEKLNEEFEALNPNYFEDHKDEDIFDLTEYNSFMAEGYMREVVNDFNEQNESMILNFYVDPEEVNFTGYLKVDRSVTIDFYLKEV